MLKLMFRKACYSFFIFMTFVVFLGLFDFKQNSGLEELDKDYVVRQVELDDNNIPNFGELSDTDFLSEDNFEPDDDVIDENRKQTDDYQSSEFDEDNDDDDDNGDEDVNEKEVKEEENSDGDPVAYENSKNGDDPDIKMANSMAGEGYNFKHSEPRNREELNKRRWGRFDSEDKDEGDIEAGQSKDTRRNKAKTFEQREQNGNVENDDENSNADEEEEEMEEERDVEEENEDDEDGDDKSDGKFRHSYLEYSYDVDQSTEKAHQVVVKTPFYGRFDYIKNSYEKTGSDAIRPARPKPVFQKPEGEMFTKRRFPQAVIIGFPKCGTRALLDFIAFHPYVVKSNEEVHFYDKNFFKGYQWYLQQMPYSWSNQVTMEKTPAYSRTPRARREMKRKFPDIKLIVLVRDPVKRIVSQEAQMASKGIRYFPNTPLSKAFINIRGTGIDHWKYAVSQSRYYEVLLPWFRDFPREQILVLNGDEFIKAPLGVLKRVEEFLKIPKFFTEDNLLFVKDRGFYCIQISEPRPKIHCIGSGKGVKHKQLSKEHETMLYKYFKPYNEKLFRLLNQRFDWEQPVK